MFRAFNHISYPRLLYNLKIKGLLAQIIRWVKSFLLDRETSLTLNYKISNIKPVYTNIPQGLLISPILFLFFNASLIKDCARMGLKIVIRGFINNINILTYGLITEGNYQIIERPHHICENQAQIYSALFTPYKYKLIHLARAP